MSLSTILPASENQAEAIVSDFANRFKAFSLKSVEMIIDIGTLVDDAKRTLTSEQYVSFVSEIGYDADLSTIRKFERIGQMNPIFIEYIECLPAAWTTIYKMTQLGPQALADALEKGIISTKTTSADISHILASMAPSSKVSSIKNNPKAKRFSEGEYAIRLEFSGIPASNAVLSELQEKLAALINELNIDCRVIQTPALMSLQFPQPAAA